MNIVFYTVQTKFIKLHYKQDQIKQIQRSHFLSVNSHIHTALLNLKITQISMTASIDKSVYLKFWQQISSSNESQIRTQKIIQWIKSLLTYEQQLAKKPDLKKQMKGKMQKGGTKQEKEKINKKAINKNKNLQTQTVQQNQQGLKNQDISKPLLDSIEKVQINEEIILNYIKKYVQTDQYKLLSKSQEKESEPQLIKEEKEKKSQSKSPSKKSTKKTQPKVPQTKYDEALIILSYEESIFFYYWFKKVYEKDEKQRFLQKMRVEQQNAQKLKLAQQQETEKNQIKNQPAQGGYQPKYFMQLTERQMSYLNEESFLSLKQHEPKLKILFKHYSKLSFVPGKQIFTFEQRHVLQQMMTLHQWMIFCKEWNILNAKSINEGWEVGKVTREFLLDVYHRNSFYRKEMSFQMFQRAIIAVSSRMYQDCDIYQAKPIDMMLTFLSIKNEHKFIQNLQVKNISYRQGDMLNCFKLKNRDAYQKMNIIKLNGNNVMRKSKLTLLKSKQIGVYAMTTDNQMRPDQMGRYSDKEFNKRRSEANLLQLPKQQSNHIQQTFSQNYSTGSLSKSSSNRHNRKSAPQIGLKLPSIQSNKFFQKIPQNNHLNKFRDYIQTQVPQSSSVLRNKITGYHTIHALQVQGQEQKMSLKNRADHDKINKLIGNKLENIFQSSNLTLTKQNLEALKKEEINLSKNQQIKAENEDKIKVQSFLNASIMNSIDKMINPEHQSSQKNNLVNQYKSQQRNFTDKLTLQ